MWLRFPPGQFLLELPRELFVPRSRTAVPENARQDSNTARPIRARTDHLL